VEDFIMLSRNEIKEALTRWNQAWDEHDLDGVMELFHEDVLFENWTGAKVQGKQALHQAWKPWFKNHRGFRFAGEDLFIDETEGAGLISSISGMERLSAKTHTPRPPSR
jgi:uncharacterized protein (TIGR02246 family)